MPTNLFTPERLAALRVEWRSGRAPGWDEACQLLDAADDLARVREAVLAAQKALAPFASAAADARRRGREDDYDVEGLLSLECGHLYEAERCLAAIDAALVGGKE